jgi:hypothetical protein
MNFNDPNFWTFVVTMCSIALLTEAARIIHVLFVTRQCLWRYLLAIIPIAVSILSCIVVWNASKAFGNLSLVTHLHINQAWWLARISPLIHALQLQIGISIVVFTILLFVERMVLPRTNQPPTWTLALDCLFPANL